MLNLYIYYILLYVFTEKNFLFFCNASKASRDKLLRKCLDTRRKKFQPTMDTPTATSQYFIPISALVHNAACQEDGAEQQVNDALDTLVETGAIQKHNRMDIEELPNLVEETELIDETTDEEIFREVIDELEGHQNSEIMGGNDSGPTKSCPTATEALQAILLITNYTDTINDSIAWKLEGVLRCFRHQIHLEKPRAMKIPEL